MCEDQLAPSALALGAEAELTDRGFVYLHGFASSPGSNKAQRLSAELRADGYHVRIPDQNEDDFEGLTVSRALALAERNLFERTVLIGSSMGAYVATLLAQREAEGRGRVAALVLMAPAFDLADRLRHRYGSDAVARWARDGRVEVDHYGYGEPRAIGHGFLVDAERHEARPSILPPAYVLTGKRDEVVPHRMVAEVVSASDPSIVFEVVDDDHGLERSAPRALAAARRFGQAYLRG